MQNLHMYLFLSCSQLVGGPFDLKEKFLIQEPGVIPLLLELLPSLPEDLQVTAEALLAVLAACLTTKCGLLR